MVSEMRYVYVYKRAQNLNANCFGVKNESSSSSSICFAALWMRINERMSECVYVQCVCMCVTK